MKFNHYFDQNRIEKKDIRYKIKEPKKKETMTKEMVTNKLQEQIKYQEKIIKNNKKHQQTVSD